MAPEKTSGTDGLPCEFYKVFWNDLAEILVNALNHSFETGMLSVVEWARLADFLASDWSRAIT